MKISNWMLASLLILQGALVSSSPYGKYINTPCTAASDCGLDTHLQCINNYCQCDSLTQIYDQSTQKCLLLLRQQCQAVSGTTSEKHHDHYNQSPPIKCVPHAECRKSACRCRTGYRASVDFLCKPDYGTACHAHDECDDAQGLICGPQGICQCFNSTWSYQGQFGCVDPNNPQYNEMLRLLNQTEQLLKENNLELKDMFNDLGLQNDPDAGEFTLNNVLASSRQDTYNTNDLQFAAQNQNNQQAGGRFNLQQLLTLFSTFQNLVPRGNGGGGGGGGGGFFRNLFRGGGGGGGYPEASTPPPAPGYQASGQPEGMGQRMGLLNSFLQLFNQMIPIVRQLRMRFSPVKFFQNLISRFAPSTTAAPAPAPAAIHNAPPTIISSNGNYETNPIFDNNPGQEQSQGNAQGQGSFRFFMRSRQRFRNFLRGNRPGGGGGGYDYTPANPPDKYGPPKYGPPAAGYGPPAEDAPPADAPPPAEDGAAAGAASSAQQNFFSNNPRAGFHGPNQPQYSTVHVSSGGVDQQHEQQIPQSAPVPAQRQQHFGGHQASNSGAFNSGHQSPNSGAFNPGHQAPNPSSFNPGHNHNPPSFFASQSNNHHNQPSQQQFGNNVNLHNSNNFNAQATSHHQSTFVPHPQATNNQANIQTPPNNHNIFNSDTNSFVRTGGHIPSITASPPPPPIPQFKLPAVQHPPKVPSSTHESLSQNFILSEADDPHPGFTPLSTPTPSGHQDSFRTSARFERIGHLDPQQQQQQHNTAAQNWRETF